METLLHLGVWLINITVVCAGGQQLIDEVCIIYDRQTYNPFIYFFFSE